MSFSSNICSSKLLVSNVIWGFFRMLFVFYHSFWLYIVCFLFKKLLIICWLLLFYRLYDTNLRLTTRQTSLTNEFLFEYPQTSNFELKDCISHVTKQLVLIRLLLCNTPTNEKGVLLSFHISRQSITGFCFNSMQQWDLRQRM